MGKVMLVGWLACLGAWLLGAPLVWEMVAAVLYAGAWLRGVPRVMLLVAAPIVATAGLVLLVPWQMAAGAGVALVALVPLFWVLGRRLPWQGPVVALGAAALVLGVLWWSPYQATFFSSDVATRAQVMVLAGVALAYGLLKRAPSSGASTGRAWAR